MPSGVHHDASAGVREQRKPSCRGAGQRERGRRGTGLDGRRAKRRRRTEHGTLSGEGDDASGRCDGGQLSDDVSAETGDRSAYAD